MHVHVWFLLFKAIPVRFIPLEMLRNARERLMGQTTAFPQLVYVSLQFGALSARMTAETLAGNRYAVTSWDPGVVRCEAVGHVCHLGVRVDLHDPPGGDDRLTPALGREGGIRGKWRGGSP